jgi:general nucleoside transport system permease protein
VSATEAPVTGRIARRAAGASVALALVAIVCALMGASPLGVAACLWDGAFGTTDQVARVAATLAPLLLAATGLCFTFRAGLYNLGVEGQIVVGAIATTGLARALEARAPLGLVVAVALLGGALTGALTGSLTAALYTRGRVSEIFAGLGMNFVAQGAALYLVFGPWKRPGVASMAGTEPLARGLSLGTLGATDASPLAVGLAVAAVIAATIVLRGTHFGLRLRAVGQSPRAAEVLGVPAERELLAAFFISGALAGLAGALQVLAVFHRLIPSISSNLGFLALLVAMLAGFDAALVAPVALFFSALNVGSLKLPMTLRLESSVAGVLQGVIVLVALAARREAAPGDAAPDDADPSADGPEGADR